MRISNEVKKNNVDQLIYISKDMAKLANRLANLSPVNPAHKDNLGSGIVETSFFVNAYGLASNAFKKMVTDLNEGDGPRGDVLFYIFAEAETFREEIEEKKRKAKEAK